MPPHSEPKRLSLTEEDYLKAIYHLSENAQQEAVSTNNIARRIEISAASVSDMLKKLSQKDLIIHIKYQGVKLTESGKKQALELIRKHRLWETFLVKVLHFSWEQVHEIAEQLEHIHSTLLIDRLEEFLEFPAFDPHGDPIPTKEGVVQWQTRLKLSQAPLGVILQVVAVKETSAAFLKYLNKIALNIHTQIEILELLEYDQSLEICIEKQKSVILSKEVAESIFVMKKS